MAPPSEREALRERLRAGRARAGERATRRDYRPRPMPEFEPPPRRVSRRKRSRRERRSIAGRAEVALAPEARLPVYRANLVGLLNAFETGALARADFTHAAHLVVALAYARGRRAEGFGLLRAGLQRYNAATGWAETPTRGYHETITRTWYHLVLHFLDLFDEGQPLQALADDLVQVFERDDLFRHYSREALARPAARAGWIDPDRAPLPALASPPTRRGTLVSRGRAGGRRRGAALSHG